MAPEGFRNEDADKKIPAASQPGVGRMPFFVGQK
jgi:hypothetical protein